MLTASLVLSASLASSSMNGISPTVHALRVSETVAATTNTGIIRFGHSIGRGKALVGPYITNNPSGHAWENGRVWVGRSIIGPGPSPQRVHCEVPGPAAFGVRADDRTTILVQLGTIKVGISPWQRLEGRANRRLEDARNQWLYEAGYTTGVRTFVNDAYAVAPQAVTRDLQPTDQALTFSQPEHAQPVRGVEIQPRATIRIPADAPRFRKRMHVQRCEPAIIVASCEGQDQVRTVTGRGNASAPTIVVRPNVKVAAVQ
jgi:hypothetical protein